jgi:hypothetical protein
MVPLTVRARRSKQFSHWALILPAGLVTSVACTRAPTSAGHARSVQAQPALSTPKTSTFASGPVVTSSAAVSAQVHVTDLPVAPAPIMPSTTLSTKEHDAYDLEVDVAKRLQDAKDQLGPGASALRITPVFLLAGPNAGATSGAKPFIDAVLAAFMNGRFGRAPERAITIFMFPQVAQFHAFCRKRSGANCISEFGFYDPSDRIIIMNGGANGTLSHELTHPFVEADFPNAPTWLNEGIASLYEQPILAKKGEIHGGKNWRLPRLKQAVYGNSALSSIARLDTLMTLTEETFRDENESLHYAIARYMCQWLDERGMLWDFYHAYRDSFADDPTGAKSFTKVVGASPRESTEVWLKWVRNL